MMFLQVSSTVTASRPHGHFKHEPTRGEGIRYSLIYGVPTCGSCLPGFDVEKDWRCVLVSGIITTLLFSRIFKNIWNNLAGVTIFYLFVFLFFWNYDKRYIFYHEDTFNWMLDPDGTRLSSDPFLSGVIIIPCPVAYSDTPYSGAFPSNWTPVLGGS